MLFSKLPDKESLVERHRPINNKFLANDARTQYLENSPYFLGLEFEFENTGDLQRGLKSELFLSNNIGLHADGSQRQNGAEFVFNRPLNNAEAENSIQFIMKHALNFKCTTSRRTGLHAHINMLDATVGELYAYLWLYLFLEEAIYHYCGDDRFANVFCVPIYRSQFCTDSLSKQWGHLHKIKLDAAFTKYVGLNILPLQRFGTFEWRQQRATLNETKVFNWVNVIIKLRKLASAQWRNFDDLVGYLLSTGNYRHLLELGNLRELDYPRFVEDINYLTLDLSASLACPTKAILKPHIEYWQPDQQVGSSVSRIPRKEQQTKAATKGPALYVQRPLDDILLEAPFQANVRWEVPILTNAQRREIP